MIACPNSFVRKLLLFACLVTSYSAFSQSSSVSGVVRTSDDHQPFPGVTVTVKGTTQATSTDDNGKFTLTHVPQGATLVFGAVGFSSKELPLHGQTSVNISLARSDSHLDEVVVVGYGTQKKRDLTGSISSLTSKEIEAKNPTSVFQALQGQAPGVSITSNSGRPGDGFSIRIRGTSTFQGGVNPLYVVDGVPTDDISDINPQDIASMEILKDAASAAIYGSRSANGVVIITTRQGKTGKPSVSAQYYKSYHQLTHKMIVGTADELRDYWNLQNVLNGKEPSVNRDSLNPLQNADNDYQDLLFRLAHQDQLNLSVSGGSPGLKYFASTGFLGEEGIVIGNRFDRFNTRINVDYQPVKKLQVINHLSFSYARRMGVSESNIFRGSLIRPPNFSLYNPDGTYTLRMKGQYNPLAWATELQDHTFDYKALLNTILAYKVVKGLELRASMTGDFRLQRRKYYVPLILTTNGDPSQTNGRDITRLDMNWINEDYFTYNKDFGKHHFTLLGGISLQQWHEENSQVYGSGFASDLVTTLNGASLLDVSNTKSTATVHTLASGFGRLSYNYADKYLLNINVRRDGSSRFGSDHKWGWFPSVSAGWRFSDEPFMRWASGVLEDGKIRASYGLTGNERIDNYASKQLYDIGSFYDGVSGISPSQFGNPDLSWESTRQRGIGMDLSFFRGRLTVTADYYDKLTDKLLYDVPLPTTSGFGSVLKNIGSIENKGLEIGLNGIIWDKNNFRWSSTFNISFNSNRIRELANHTPFQTGSNGIFLIKEGLPIGTIYGYKALEIFPYDQSNAFTDDWQQLTPNFDNDGNFTGYTLDGKSYSGDVKQLKANGKTLVGGDVHWMDLNKDGKIDQNDEVVIGHGVPKFFGGFTNSFQYKNFSLSVLFDFEMGNDTYNEFENRYRSNFNTHYANPNPDIIAGTWKKPGDIAKWPRAIRVKADNTREPSSLWIEKGAYIKLRNIRLGYSLPRDLLQKIKMKNISVFAQVNEVLTWTAYTGYDPEFEQSSDPLQEGVDRGKYPRSREFGLGINVNF